jgi:hypothetical protein
MDLVGQRWAMLLVRDLSPGPRRFTDLFAGLSSQRATENSGMIRLDQRFGNSTAAFLRVNVDESVTDNPLGNLRDRTVADARPINGVLAVNKVLSPSMLNEVRVGFNQVF